MLQYEVKVVGKCKGCCLFQDTPCRWKVLSPSRKSGLIYPMLHVSMHLFPSHDRERGKKLKVQKTAGCQTIFHPYSGAARMLPTSVKKGSTYRACLLEVSIFLRRNLHNSTFRERKTKSLVTAIGAGGCAVSRMDERMLEKRVLLRRHSEGPRCGNDSLGKSGTPLHPPPLQPSPCNPTYFCEDLVTLLL